MTPEDVGIGQLFGTLADAVVVINVETGRIVLWNPAAEDIFGYTEAEALGMDSAALIPEPLKQRHRDGLARYHATRRGTWVGARQPAMLPALRKGGGELVIELTLSPILQPRLPGHYVLGLIRDVTARRRTEEALAAREAQLRGVVDSAPLVLLALDRDGRFTLAEGKGLETLGPRAAHLVGRSAFEVYADAPQVGHDVRRALAGETFSSVARLGAVAFETRYIPQRDAAGAVSGVIGVGMDITERQRAQDALEHQALHDGLTQLPNRSLFRRELERALGVARRAPTSPAVLFLDLDNFKAINDSFGHDAGDRVLLEVASRLTGCVRPTDVVARFGGDEFAVLLDDLHEPDVAMRVAERVLDALRVPVTVQDRQFTLGVSIGIARPGPDRNCADDLLRDADVAMYRAKSEGKGRYAVFEPQMHRNALARLELATDLRQAVERGQFVLRYQPIVLLASGQVTGMEALLRWQHPRRGLVAPADFIPLAEETGLILPIGRWVLQAACRQARAWQEAFPTDPPRSIAVNLSARQLQHPELVDQVAAALAETGLPPAALILELTESMMMGETLAVILRLQELKDLGVRIAIDDFGTGYSSLSYLQRFPIDILKIDRSFVSASEKGREQAAVLATIVALGKTLNLRTVAEGIERQEQRDRLHALDCEHGQGYYFARPLTEEQMSELLHHGRVAPADAQPASLVA